MATKISEYSATPASNTDLDGINLSENVMVPSDVNDALRMQMAHLKDLDTGASALTSPEFASATMTGDLNFGTNNKATFGSGDLQIYHTGGYSRISDEGAGSLVISTNGNNIQLAKGSTELMLVATPDSDVKLYHNNLPKLATTDSGIDVTGTVTADGLTVDGVTKIGVTSAPTWDTNSFLWTKAGVGLNVESYRVKVNTGSSRIERMRIDANGDISFYDNTGVTQGFYWDASTQRLGLGTTTPDAPLEIESSGSNFATLKLNAPSNTTPSGFLVRAHDGDFDIRDANNSATRLVIDSSGNLLHQRTSNTISGTSVNKMTLGNGTGQYGAIIDVGSGSGYYGFAKNGAYNSRIRYDYTNNFMAFDVNTSERMRIDGSTGNIGIGTTATTGAKLKVDGGATAGTIIQAGNAQGGVILGAESSTAYINTTSSTPLAFEINNSEKVRILAGGGITFNGDTAAANALDDYEEGTWTATIGDDSGNTSNTSTGYYTKIGNLVRVHLNVITNISTAGLVAGDAIQISGLPYNPTNGNHAGSCYLTRTDFNGKTQLIPFAKNGTDQIRFQTTGDDLNNANILVSNVLSGVADLTSLVIVYHTT